MNIALIMAAGSGKRIGGDIPKQFLEINDNPLLYYTLKVFNESTSIDAIYIVTNKSYFNKVDEISCEFEKVLGNIEGGDTRQESAYKGIKYLTKNGFVDDDVILIHDAARPMVSGEIINNNVLGCLKYDAVVTSVAASDTVIRSYDKDVVNDSEKRSELFLNQTPQTFKLGLLVNSYKKVENELEKYTDDCQIVKNYGHEVHIIPGSKLNFKVTTKEDLELAKSLLK